MTRDELLELVQKSHSSDPDIRTRAKLQLRTYAAGARHAGAGEAVLRRLAELRAQNPGSLIEIR